MNWLLASSLIVNVVLASLLVIPNTPSRSVRSNSQPVLSRRIETPRAPTPALPVSERIERKKSVSPHAQISLQSDDYATFIQNLREVGLTEDSIALLIAAKLRGSELDERYALGAKLKRGEITLTDLNQRVKQMHRDTEAKLEALLGRETYRRHQIQQDYYIQPLADSGRFPQDVLDKIYELNRKDADRRSEISERTQGLGYFAHQVESIDIDQTYREELEQTFGPEVARQIRLVTDDQVQRLRSQMAAVSMSDEELDRAAQIIKQTNEQKQRLEGMRARGDLSYGDLHPQTSTLDQEQKEQLKTILGPERYAEYEKQNDYLYIGLKPQVAAKVLTRAEVEHVYQVMKAMQNQQNELSNRTQAQQVTVEDVRAAIQQLQASTKKSLEEYLGAERYKKIKPYTGLQ